MSALPKFTMRFEPMTIEHLGTKLYTRIGPVVTELVSNSWDADAEKVEITFPEGEPTEIKIRDYGNGMTSDEVQDAYLLIGRNCRQELSRDVTPKKRPIMGRKGIGKLAVFGIASDVEIRTIKNGNSVCLKLEFEEMKKWPARSKEPYAPKIIEERCGRTTDKDGTEIWLTKLHRKTPISSEIMKKELAKRFTVIEKDDFQVFVNGSQIKPEDRQLKQSCEKVWEMDELPEKDVISEVQGWKVTGWAGILPIPSTTDKGIDIFVRGKAAEINSMFNDKSAHNAVARNYVVGEIHADFLDSADGEDHIGTARNTVQWGTIPGEMLEKWGQRTVRFVLEQWIKILRDKKEKQVIKTAGFDKWLEGRTGRERTQAMKLVKTIVDDNNIQSESTGPLLDMIKANIEFEAFQDLIDEMEKSGGSVDLLLKLVGEWRIIEAREYLKLADGQLEIIEKLDKFRKEGALEVQHMQPLFEENSWLINPSWGKVSGQNTYTELLRKNCKEPKELGDVDRRMDILGYEVGGRINIVELKHPTKTLSRKDLEQIEKYHDWAKSRLEGSGPDSPRDISALLIVGQLSTDGAIKEKVKRLAGSDIRVETYADLVVRARKIYGRVEKDLKKIAPEYSSESRKKRKNSAAA